jgi:tetratricopeptide (TPR) repeat protein
MCARLLRGYRGSLCLTTALVIALLAHPAEAQDRARALELNRRAQESYQAGAVEEAIALLTEALEILPEEPALHFNLARAYETAGQREEAISAYERYLELHPDAQDRGAIERRLVALREREVQPPPPPRVIIVPTPPPPSGVDPAPWIFLGVGVLAAGGGIPFGVLSQDARAEAVRDPVHDTAVEAYDRAHYFAISANLLFGVGGAMALAGLIWGIVSLTSQGPSPVTLTPNGISVALDP